MGCCYLFSSLLLRGRMGSSIHRSSRRMAIGGKAPYLMPFFGMFGYGGPIASMHVGRNAIVASKTKGSKKVCTLHLSREALMKKSTDKYIWRADGAIRNPLDEELQLSPHGSFTKVEICNLKMRCMETFQLQCLLKDIYFPYIQCDEDLSSKRTTTPIEFQVNDTDLAEIEGGEAAVTNLHSCNGPDFVLQLHLTVNDGDETSKSHGSSTCRQANAQLKCVYFPIVEGKENIDRILEKLEIDGFPKKEAYEKFWKVAIRRLGRLLPDARWRALPFMEPHQKRGDKAQLLRRCCHRVKCFIDTDAGFSPTPSKVNVMQAPKLELVPIENPEATLFHSQYSDDGVLPLSNSSQCSPSQVNLLVETIKDDIRNLDDETKEAGLQVRKHEEKLKILNVQKDQIGKEICYMEGRMGPQCLTRTESLANSKGWILKQIEGKRNNAASVFCNLSKAIQIAGPQKHFMQDFVGLVALLGTVSDGRLSSMFSEYLGENYMLAIVCKSYEAASALEEYGENGKVIRDSALHEAAASLQITINRRFSVICLEEIRPYKGAIKNPQRKLALPNPLLPSQKIPDGFLGYAVNMIDLDAHHLNTTTAAGYGLRETLFYRLFGETQVYETRQQMRAANACIKHGALSLDGGIMKENGIIVLGDSEPDIKFPVLPHSQGEISLLSIEILDQIEKKKALLAETCEEINKEREAHLKAVAKFQKKKDKLRRFLEKKSSSMGKLLVDRSPQWKTR